jgi:hypothetical protein
MPALGETMPKSSNMAANPSMSVPRIWGPVAELGRGRLSRVLAVTH